MDAHVFASLDESGNISVFNLIFKKLKNFKDQCPSGGNRLHADIADC